MKIPVPKSFKLKISLWNQKIRDSQNEQILISQTQSFDLLQEEIVQEKLDNQHEKQLLAGQQDLATSEWELKYETYANYLEGQNFMKTINSIGFGNTIINPYHVFQIRRLPGISAKMRICKDQSWFKIHDVLRHPEVERFLNIITIQLPKLSFNSKSSENIT